MYLRFIYDGSVIDEEDFTVTSRGVYLLSDYMPTKDESENLYDDLQAVSSATTINDDGYVLIPTENLNPDERYVVEVLVSLDSDPTKTSKALFLFDLEYSASSTPLIDPPTFDETTPVEILYEHTLDQSAYCY